MTVGIYKLEFAGTDKVYIGQSLNIEARFGQHLHRMRKGTSSARLNTAYSHYGNPTYDIVAKCTESELDSLEAEIIEIYNSVDNGFNTCSKAGGKSALSGEYHANSEYSNKQVIEVLHMLVRRLDLNIPEISEALNVSKSLILGISSLTTHKWLEKVEPVEYQLLTDINNKGTRRNCTKNGPKVDTYRLVAPSGEVYVVTNTLQFAKVHNLDRNHLGKLRIGTRKSHKGWKLCPEF